MTASPNRPVRAVRRAHLLHVARVLFPLLVVAAPAHADGSIPWRTQFEAAESEARASNRPLWVQFTGSWCGVCRRMESEVFPRPEVAALGREAFVPVKVDADSRADLLARFGITGLPTTMLVGPDNRVLARNEGYLDPASLLALLGPHRPAPSAPAAEGAEIALAGYDPVSLVEGEGLEPGRPSLTARYDGQEFRFADPDDRAAFLRDPERYLPVGRGHCPVLAVDRGRSVVGNPRFSVYYRGRLFTCSSEQARRRFAADPARYADADLADDGHCPHCRSLAGSLVRGRPEYSAVYRGRRYLFPDAEHLQAFRSAPETYLR